MWLAFLTLSHIASGQVDSSQIFSDLSFYSDVMANAGDARHRQRAREVFESTLQSFLEKPGSYHTPLDSLKWISVVNGEKFRIITWQVLTEEKEFKYGGYIQWPDKLEPLKDNRPWINGSLRNTYTPAAWYGALYYKLLPFKSDGKEYYILFGFNGENGFVNTKVVDVLDINGTIRFGLPVFIKDDDPQTRLILTYSDASSVQLLYDESLEAIVHDHLESLPGLGPEGSALAVSDGSQEGWILKKGKWHYQEKMYDVISNEPPMTEERKIRKEDKDILGRPKKE
jgi:hypothetical protein